MDACTGWKFMQMFNVTKNVLNEIKTELEEYDCGTWKKILVIVGKGGCVTTYMKPLSEFSSIKNGSYSTVRFK